MKMNSLWVGIWALSLGSIAAQAEPVTTSFHCTTAKVSVAEKKSNTGEQETIYVTVARRGNRQTSPMILWRTELGGFTPQERCKLVSDRLSTVVARNEGKLRNLFLTSGRVDGQPVICHVETNNPDEKASRCTRKNVLFTLRPQDKGNEQAVLKQLVTFSVTGTGSPLSQTEPQLFASFGEEIEKSLGTPASSTSDAATGGI